MLKLDLWSEQVSPVEFRYVGASSFADADWSKMPTFFAGEFRASAQFCGETPLGPSENLSGLRLSDQAPRRGVNDAT
jgi:hypothetical protein